MTAGQTILEILKYIIPAIVVLIATSIIVSKFLVNDTKRKQMAIFQEGLETTLRLRLQAYERLALYLERIHPRELITRVYESGMTAQDLHHTATAVIRAEFEHNLSQQIYVSTQVWKTVQSVKEQEIAMINQIAAQMKPDAPAKELHKRIVDFVVSSEDALPVEIALEILQSEAKLVLSQKI